MGFNCLKDTEQLIKFRQQVNLIQRVPLGTPPQEIVMSLPHNHADFDKCLSLVIEGYCYQI